MHGSGVTRRRSDLPRVAAVCALLLLAVGIVFGRAVGHDFVNYDDDLYVTENRHVRDGLSAGGVAWALTTRHASNWHPLTWLSHMFDAELHGMHPGGHHLTSVLLHGLNAALLFLVLLRMTGQLPASALAAALFAVHPLRAESVAWVAERKDVLSGSFFLLALGAHLWRARRPSSPAGATGVAAALALGLLAKPMLVTLPLVLLLLDHWPLGRTRTRPLTALALEKAPLLALSALSCVVTLWAQAATVVPGGTLPLTLRLGNAAVALAAYVGDLLFPARLAPFYPHPGAALPGWKAAAAALALAGATAVFAATRQRRPHWFIGWLWFAGMLVPVSGLVQVGDQGMADRYTYLPQIGLAVAVAWAVARQGRAARARGGTICAAALASVALLAAAAWKQAGAWRDSQTLFAHALDVGVPSHIAHNNLGVVLAARGQADEAIAHYRRALAFKPDYAESHNNLGNLLAARGQLEEAIAAYRRALAARPGFGKAHNNLGNVLAARGRLDEAVASFRRALVADPDFPEAHNNLGNALAARGRADEAIASYRRALGLRPDFAEAHNNLGVALAARGRTREAIASYRRALELKPGYARAQDNLAAALAAGDGRVGRSPRPGDAPRDAP